MPSLRLWGTGGLRSTCQGSVYEFGYVSLSETKIVAFTRYHDPCVRHFSETGKFRSNP